VTLFGQRETRVRALSALGAVLVLVLSLWAMVSGLAVKWYEEAAQTIAVALDANLSPAPEREDAAPLNEGAAADPAFREVPVEVVAPPPEILIERPDPPPAAPAPATGTAADAGATAEPGEGRGAGSGEGTGAGSGGTGPGGGGQTPARLVSGAINDPRIFDRALSAQRVRDVAEYRFVVLANGRIFGCRPQKTSGSAALDAHVCGLLEQRLRYEPARNARGEAVPDEKAYRQVWRRG
jgi:protein TonB